MGKQKQKSSVKKQMDEQLNLLKIVAEQNHERILEYDVRADYAKVYGIIDGAFEIIHEVSDYIKEDNIGKYFNDAESEERYRQALNSCLIAPDHQLIDIQYRRNDGEAEWYRVHLVSVADDEGMVSHIIGRIASVQNDKVANEMIRRRAEIDALTNVYNHKAFEETCERELAAGKDNGIFLMMDVDDFKMINDTQGHNVGDLVLSQTGAILNEAVKGHGIAGRLGGDEFAAFVWNFDSADEMHEFCVTLRENLKTIIFDMEYSASIGVGVLEENHSLSFSDLYFEADQAVYAAKHHGKNQIIFYEDIEQNTTDEQSQVDEDYECESENMDEHAILAQMKVCLDYFKIESFEEAMMHVKQAMCVFYDADVVTIVERVGEERCVASEYHKESADMMAKLIVDEVEKSQAKALVQLLGEREDIYVHNIKRMKDSNPSLYAHFADKRIWSVMMANMIEQNEQVGIIAVINPRKHTEDSALIHMLGEYLSARMMYRQDMKESKK